MSDKEDLSQCVGNAHKLEKPVIGREEVVNHMNLENIRELRTVRGETEINELLSSGKWRVLNLVYEDEGVVATLAKVRA